MLGLWNDVLRYMAYVYIAQSYCTWNLSVCASPGMHAGSLPDINSSLNPKLPRRLLLKNLRRTYQEGASSEHDVAARTTKQWPARAWKKRFSSTAASDAYCSRSQGCGGRDTLVFTSELGPLSGVALCLTRKRTDYNIWLTQHHNTPCRWGMWHYRAQQLRIKVATRANGPEPLQKEARRATSTPEA